MVEHIRVIPTNTNKPSAANHVCRGAQLTVADESVWHAVAE